MMTPTSHKNVLAELSISSAASIIYNNGFETARSSVLNLLNSLMMKYFEALCRKEKYITEQNAPQSGINPNIMHRFDLESLKDYMQNVKQFHANIFPSLPIKECVVDSAEQINFTTMGLTTMQLEKEDFPSYKDCSAADLGIQPKADKYKHYPTSNTSLADNTLDSLASPILAHRRPRFARKKINKNVDNKNLFAAKKVNENNLKAVVSKEGIKLRLINEMENTPPGYISGRTRSKNKL